MIVIEAQNIDGAILPVGPAGAGVKSLRAGAACKRREGIHQTGVGACPVEPEINIVLLAPATATPSPTTATAERSHRSAAGRTEIVNQTEDHRVGTAVVRSDVVKILAHAVGGDIRKWNVLQQVFGGGAEESGVNLVEHSVELILLSIYGIEELHWRAVVVARIGKIAVAFGQRGNSGKRIVGRIPAGSVPPEKEKPLVAAIENLGNVQRPSDIRAKMRLVVFRLGSGKSAE